MTDRRLSFSSDNAAGAHPEILAAIARANEGHCPAYGDDPHSEAALHRVRAHFGEDAEALFVFNGTGANVLALRCLVRDHEAVLCADSSHLWEDECGAPEHQLGCKLVPIPASGGKLSPDDLRPTLGWRGSVHNAQPGAISITQSTEWGTVYQPHEIRALADFAREHDLRFHVDGARLANAAAGLGVSLRALTTDIGVDAVSFGGTKNGLLFGEAVVFPQPERLPDRARYAGFYRKQTTQLASKMRFLAAQFEALLGEDELWLRNARHANAMARRLAEGVGPIAGVEILQPVEANGVFAALPPESLERLAADARFLVWDEAGNVARWMTAFDTRPEDVDRFVECVAAAVDP